MSVLATGLSLLLAAPAAPASVPTLASPNGRLELRVRTAERLRFDVWLSGRPLLLDSTLALRVDGRHAGPRAAVRATRTERVDRVLEPPVRQKAQSLRERYNELRLELEGGYAVVVPRLRRGRRLPLRDRAAEAGGQGRRPRRRASASRATGRVYFHEEESFFSHNERHYARRSLKELAAGRARQHAGGGGRRRREDRDRRRRHRGLPGPLAAGRRRQRRSRPSSRPTRSRRSSSATATSRSRRRPTTSR